MSKIRDNPFYFIFLNLISSGVKQLPVSYGLILINFASVLVNTAQYILIIGSYLYTSYSNWSLRRLRRRVDDFMNTKGTSTISDVDLDSAIRLTQSQILSSLRESGHLSGHFVQAQQRSSQPQSQQPEQLTQGQLYNHRPQLSQQRTTQHRDEDNRLETQTQPSNQQTFTPAHKPQQRQARSSYQTRESRPSPLERNQSVPKQNNLNQSRGRIQSQDSQVLNRTPSKYVTEPRPHSSRSIIESSIGSLCSERSDIIDRPGSVLGQMRSNDQVPLKVSQSGDQIYEREEPDDLISLKEVPSSSHSPTNQIRQSDSSSVLRKRLSSDQSNSSIPEQVRTENNRVSATLDAVSSVPTTARNTTDRDSTIRNSESSIAERFTGKIIESAQKVFSRTSSRSSRRSSVSTSTSNSDLHNKAFLEDPTKSSGSLGQEIMPRSESGISGPVAEMDSQRLTVVRGDEEQTRQSLAAEMPRMTFMQQQFGTISEENSSSGGSFDPFADDRTSVSTSQNHQFVDMVKSSDPNRRLDAGDTGSQLEIIGGVKYLKDRLQMEKEALIKIKNEQAMAKTRNDQIVDEAVCQIDSVKTNIRGNLNQIRNLFKS